MQYYIELAESLSFLKKRQSFGTKGPALATFFQFSVWDLFHRMKKIYGINISIISTSGIRISISISGISISV